MNLEELSAECTKIVGQNQINTQRIRTMSQEESEAIQNETNNMYYQGVGS